MKETAPFTVTSLRKKYVGINLAKKAKDLYSKNCKMLMNATEDDTNRWKDIPCSWIARIDIVKIFKAIYRFNVIPVKLSMALFKKN